MECRETIDDVRVVFAVNSMDCSIGNKEERGGY